MLLHYFFAVLNTAKRYSQLWLFVRKTKHVRLKNGRRFLSSQLPDRLLGPLSLVSNTNWRVFPRRKIGRFVRLRMLGALCLHFPTRLYSPLFNEGLPERTNIHCCTNTPPKNRDSNLSVNLCCYCQLASLYRIVSSALLNDVFSTFHILTYLTVNIPEACIVLQTFPKYQLFYTEINGRGDPLR
jgi:hypothetical protein